MSNSALIALCVLSMVEAASLVAVILTSDSAGVALARAGIITGALAGPIAGVVILLQQVSRVQETVKDVRDAVNGHLRAHLGHSDAEIQKMIEDRLAKISNGSNQ